MGLGEPKKKVRYSIDPNALSWAKDESKFGKKLMEKMGWEQGKGLGAKENGITENIKVRFKSDTKGIGFNNNQYENVWLDHQDDFESLLSSLNENNATTSSATNGSANTQTEQVQSLEERSKQSKGRLHYKKFARSKDLSNASHHDLNCILGKEKRKKLSAESKNEETNYNTNNNNGNISKSESDSLSESEMRVSFKINTTIENISTNKSEVKTNSEENPLFSTNKLSLNDYFASKMASKLKKSDSEPILQEKTIINQEESDKSSVSNNLNEEERIEEPKKKKSKKNKKSKEEVEENVITEEPSIQTNENDEKEIASSEIDIKSSFAGSNLIDIKGYSAYNINSSLEVIMKEKAKKVQKKKSIEAKNLESNPKFYEMNKKKAC